MQCHHCTSDHKRASMICYPFIRLSQTELVASESLPPPLLALNTHTTSGSTQLRKEKEKTRRRKMEGRRNRGVMLSGGRSYSSRRPIPRRGKVKASIAIGLAQSLAALFSLAIPTNPKTSRQQHPNEGSLACSGGNQTKEI
ncbi:hypothetical protein C4D60_Mb05t27960 [Musa balbisiana]|uniref:Uncharacterized protein n=1 Tax=Musa balbisiana TaxID=52838 RepID=A0A4S8JZC1_MUSBA|nr:hypothetical protein C4D60_Mb05t27960 [Musa balbisiana]